VQVLVLLYVVGMQITDTILILIIQGQITDTILILIIQGAHLGVVILATGSIMVDFKILHPLMFEEEVLMGLDLVRDLIEGRTWVWVGIIQMYAQGKATGSAQILCKFIFHSFLLYGFTLHSSTPFFVFSWYLILALLGH
jgi:hypothetical protein